VTNPTEQDFVRRARAAPDDDEPRLAYALWLRQRGDPRGDFIEASCLLARRDLEPTSDEARALDETVRRLMSQHEREWTAELRELLGDTRQENFRPATFRRGFVERLWVPPDVLATQADRLFAAAPLLRELEIGRPRRGVFDRMLGIAVALRPELAGIEQVRLFSLDLEDDAFVPLAGSPHLGALQEIDLGANRLGPASVDALLGSRFAANLTSLELWHNDLGDQGAERIAAAAPPKIRSIRLAKNGVGARGALSLASSPRLSLLESLELTENPVGDDAVVALIGSPSLGVLRTLDLYEVSLCPGGMQSLAALPGLARVERLALGGNSFADEGLWSLACSPHTGALTHLELDGAGLSDDGAMALAEACDLRRLVELGLRYNCITDAGAKALAASAGLSPHLDIDLAYNDIGHEGEAALCARFGGANLVGQGMRRDVR
jgi:uncharacterized protein (TIGR02996 family)